MTYELINKPYVPKRIYPGRGDELPKIPLEPYATEISKPYVFIFPDVLPTTHDFHLMIYIEHLSGLHNIEDFSFL